MKLFKYDIIRKTRKFLLAQPEIDICKIEHASEFHVKFTDGIVEHWSFRSRYKFSRLRHYAMPDNEFYPFDERYPELRSQFTRNPLYQKEYEKITPHFIVQHKYLDEFKFCNVRIFLHRLAARLAEEGWVEIWYPDKILVRVLEYCRSIDQTQLRADNNTYVEYIAHAIKAQPLLYTMTNVGKMAENIHAAWSRPKLFHVLDKLYRIRTDITRHSIFQMFRRYHYCKIRMGYPLSFAALLADHCPGAIYNEAKLAWVAMACLINDVPFDDPEAPVLVTANPNKITGEYKTEILIGELSSADKKFILKNFTPWAKPQIISIKSDCSQANSGF